MPLTIIDEPKYQSTFVKGEAVLYYYLNAINNVTSFKFQRKDQAVLMFENSGGVFRLKVEDNPQLAPYNAAVGESIYFAGSFGTPSESGKIVSFSQAGGYYYITTDVEFTLQQAGGYVNYSNRKNYEVELQVITGHYAFLLNERILNGVPNTEGIATIDVKNAVQSVCTKAITANYTGIATQDINDNGYFFIRYREQWKNKAGQNWTVYQKPYQYINGVLQPVRVEDNVMREWDIVATSNAKFCTDFEEPEYFVGYPFSISFYCNLQGFDKDTQALVAFQELQDINFNEQSTVKGYLSQANAGFMHHINIASQVDCNADYVDVWVEVEAIDCEDNCYVDPDYVECMYIACDTGDDFAEPEGNGNPS